VPSHPINVADQAVCNSDVLSAALHHHLKSNLAVTDGKIHGLQRSVKKQGTKVSWEKNTRSNPHRNRLQAMHNVKEHMHTDANLSLSLKTKNYLSLKTKNYEPTPT